MKTTLILRDDLVRQAKARAALRGEPLSRYVEACLEQSLAADAADTVTVEGWLAGLPRLSKAACAELQSVLEAPALRVIDKEMWR